MSTKRLWRRSTGACGRRRPALAAIALAVVIGAGAPAVVAAAPAQDDDADDVAVDDAQQQLADRFAPIIVLKRQDAECDPDGEPFAPTAIDIVLDNPEIALRQVGPSDPVVKRAPSAGDLWRLGEGFYLDFPGSSLDPGCLYEHDFQKYAAGVEPTIYAHIVQQPDEPGILFVQYWFYWYYNDWNNKHESDWEGITLKFEASSVAEALAGEPIAVGYSQHEGGERAEWDDDKLEREGDRPVVYSSARSHASYFDSAFYLGRQASEGFGCDDTTGPSDRVDPSVVVLPDGVDDADDPLAWVDYRGRWGERQRGAFNGPTGPAAKDRWLEPAPWFDELRSSSVVIPTGDTEAGGVVQVFCGAVEGGSRALITFTTSPVRLIVLAVLVTLLVRFLVGRTDWSVVDADPVVRRRRAGQIFRLAGRTYARSPLAYVLAGLAYVPAVLVTGALAAVIRRLPLVEPLLDLAGSASGTSLVIAALVGSVANVAAFLIVNAAVAAYLHGDDRGVDAMIAALRLVRSRARALGAAFVRSFVIVGVLLVSFVGAPWGLRQLVRYQFAAQAVAIDDRDGRGALDRSSELVTGRWWHTAVVAAVLNTGVGLTALVLGLLLLVGVSGIPLWLFSALASLAYALTVPLAAIAMTLLYGDAVAEGAQESADAAADPVDV